MMICGIKLTHDAAVALIDGDRLIFSIELEKLHNAPRHARMDDMDVIWDILREYGCTRRDVDQYVIDGWRTTKTRRLDGVSTPLPAAPYRRAEGAPMARATKRAGSFAYSSFSHYAGHVAGAYCTSDFAERGEPALVLCWDGAMFPFLYAVDHDGAVAELEALHLLLGDAYHELARLVPPFDEPIEWPATLALPGKVMAFAGLGTVDEDACRALQAAYDEIEAAIPLGPRTAHLDEDLGRRVLEQLRLKARPVARGLAPADFVLSLHTFIERLLLGRLTGALERRVTSPPNLCLVGGCALNIKWNTAVRASAIAEAVWIPPFANDSGSALGAACCERLARGAPPAIRWDVYSGPGLRAAPCPPGWTGGPCDLQGLAVVLHEEQEPVIVLTGTAELGPRALGHRSILASPSRRDMHAKLNAVKRREDYRPVAPMCLEHRAPDIFNPGSRDPFMLFEHHVRDEWRDRLPAVRHVDGSARLQTISSTDSRELHELLTHVELLAGTPVLCNTSANASGRGFFPDAGSAMDWAGLDRVWSDGVLYRRSRLTP